MKLKNQLIPIFLTAFTCLVLIGLLYLEIVFLNSFTDEKISLSIRVADILVGLTIYLKTSIDFAIFIGRLMEKNTGLKSRIAIEIGTAFGNAAGTMIILLIWTFFKEVDWLLAIMIFIAALVLIRLAQDGLEHIDANNPKYPKAFRGFVKSLDKIISTSNKFIEPVLSKIIPHQSLKVKASRTFWGLLMMSFTVPFILGLDDFAGYVPLFNVINVFGFAIGVFVGHMILNILLYISPKQTIKLVKNPIISLIGSMAFLGLAIWGIIEAFKLLFLH